MQNSMMLFTFFVFERKYSFSANLVQKVKIINLSWSLVPTLIRICRIHVHFFCFWSGIPFLGKFGPKTQNYQFKLKFGTYTNSTMQNSMMLFTFFVFEQKYSFSANLVQKVKIIILCWNLVTSLIRICRIQWRSSIFPFVTRNARFGQILPKMSKLWV